MLKRAKGFYSANSRCYVHAVEKVDRALAYSYRDRRQKKRQMRALWNQRINAAARMYGTTYSRLMGGLAKQNIKVDRKMLALLAVEDPLTFKQLCQLAVSESAAKV